MAAGRWMLTVCAALHASTAARAYPVLRDTTLVRDPRVAAQFARNAMIASNSTLASQAGIEMLKRGGNAVDAAVAVGFALAVAYPDAGNLGGGGYMLIHLANGRDLALDYREVAPARATRDMYLRADGTVSDEGVIGYKASGVPGSVAGLCEALRRYGTLPLRTVMSPEGSGYQKDRRTETCHGADCGRAQPRSIGDDRHEGEKSGLPEAGGSRNQRQPSGFATRNRHNRPVIHVITFNNTLDPYRNKSYLIQYISMHKSYNFYKLGNL